MTEPTKILLSPNSILEALLSGHPGRVGFIVRAVNSHEALITGIQAAIIHISNDQVKKMLTNILNQAEKGSS